MKTIKGKLIRVEGTFIGRQLFGTICFLLLNVFSLAIFFRLPEEDRSASDLLLTQTFLGIVAILAYWLTSSNYYYYQFDGRYIIIRNRLRTYRDQIAFEDVMSISFIGKNFFAKTHRDYLLFHYKNGLEINFKRNGGTIERRYDSYNFGPDDWQAFLENAKSANIVCDLRRLEPG